MSHLAAAAKAATLKITVWASMLLRGADPATPVRSPSPDSPRKHHNIPRTDAFTLMPQGNGTTCCARHPGLDEDSSDDEDTSMDKTNMGDKKIDDKEE